MPIPPPRALLSVIHYHQAPKTQPVPRVVAQGIELVEVVTGGRGWIWHERDWTEVTPGFLLWHMPGDQTIGRSDPENPYSCLAVSMAADAGAEGIERRWPRLAVWPDLQAILELTETAIGQFLDDTFDRDVLLARVFGLLQYWSFRHHHGRERAGLPEPLRRARAVIAARYAEPLKVAAIAQAAGWSVAHLHDQFRIHFGSTPRQEIHARRLRAAREQLVSTGLSVKQIAADAGFTHSSAFCSAFRRAYGRTPKSYRDAFYSGYAGEAERRR